MQSFKVYSVMYQAVVAMDSFIRIIYIDSTIPQEAINRIFKDTEDGWHSAPTELTPGQLFWFQLQALDLVELPLGTDNNSKLTEEQNQCKLVDIFDNDTIQFFYTL